MTGWHTSIPPSRMRSALQAHRQARRQAGTTAVSRPQPSPLPPNPRHPGNCEAVIRDLHRWQVARTSGGIPGAWRSRLSSSLRPGWRTVVGGRADVRGECCARDDAKESAYGREGEKQWAGMTVGRVARIPGPDVRMFPPTSSSRKPRSGYPGSSSWEVAQTSGCSRVGDPGSPLRYGRDDGKWLAKTGNGWPGSRKAMGRHDSWAGGQDSCSRHSDAPPTSSSRKPRSGYPGSSSREDGADVGVFPRGRSRLFASLRPG